MKQIQLWLIVIAGVGVSSGEALAWECGQTHYRCEAGNSINWDETETEWTWGCEDDLGNVDYCREEKPEREGEDPQEDPALPSDPDPVDSTCDPADPADPIEPEDPVIEDPVIEVVEDPVVEIEDPGMGGNDLEEDPGLIASSTDDDSDDDDDKKKKKKVVIDPARSLPAVGLPTFWIASLMLLFGLGLGLSAVFLRNTRVFTAWSKE